MKKHKIESLVIAGPGQISRPRVQFHKPSASSAVERGSQWGTPWLSSAVQSWSATKSEVLTLQMIGRTMRKTNEPDSNKLRALKRAMWKWEGLISGRATSGVALKKCSLCHLFQTENRDERNCSACPLFESGNGCLEEGSLFSLISENIFYLDSRLLSELPGKLDLAFKMLCNITDLYNEELLRLTGEQTK